MCNIDQHVCHMMSVFFFFNYNIFASHPPSLLQTRGMHVRHRNIKCDHVWALEYHHLIFDGEKKRSLMFTFISVYILCHRPLVFQLVPGPCAWLLEGMTL